MPTHQEQILTVFQLPERATHELLVRKDGTPAAPADDIETQALERIKDMVRGSDWSEMQDRGLYVFTGGFSKDAHYEADRAAIPLAL